MINSIKQKIKRIVNPVSLTDLKKCNPVSNVIGFDRGNPIDRYYIEKFLLNRAEHIKGRTLEIADSTYSKRYGRGVTSYEVLHTIPDKNTTIVGDLTQYDKLPRNYIDCFVCTQTFNFIYDVKTAIQGAHWLLKPKGVLLATVSGLSQISRYDMERWGDYWRFTDKSIKLMFMEVFGQRNVEVVVYGNILAAISLLQGISVEDLPDVNLLNEIDEDYQVTIGILAKKE